MSIKSNIPMDFGEKDQDDFSVTEQYSDGTAKRGFIEHWHDCFELIYILSGQFHVTMGTDEHLLSCGDIAVISPYCLHSTESHRGEAFKDIVFGYTESVIYSTDISFSNLKYLAPFRHTQTTERCILSGSSPQLDRLRELLSLGAAEFKRCSLTRELRMRSIILEVHAILCEQFMSPSGGSEETDERSLTYIRSAELFIEKHLTEDISPYTVADELHISYSHLSRLCRLMLGVTVSELICRMRISLAEQLLIRSPGLSVTECAMRVGFSNVSYFIKQFRRAKGISPGEFRRLLAETRSLPLGLQLDS